MCVYAGAFVCAFKIHILMGNWLIFIETNYEGDRRKISVIQENETPPYFFLTYSMVADTLVMFLSKC